MEIWYSSMVDTLSKAERSARMALVKGKNTKPELIAHRIVKSLGLKYRTHDRSLPGSPDLVFPKLKKVIFVHGCFWHRHAACKGNRTPKSKLDFWTKKLDDNKRRDARILRKLNRMGWSYLILWECQLRKPERVSHRVAKFLGGKSSDEIS